MNAKQIEIAVLLIDVFTELRLDAKYLHKVREQFNELSSEDHEWSDIEDHVIAIIYKLDKIQ